MLDQEPKETQQLTLVARVRGRVQNVGFRAYAVDVATRLGLRGYVRNCPDRSVEVVASGSRADLETLLGYLRRGPLAARVDSVEHEWLEHQRLELSERFEVRG
jgi:acylphosphatase